MANPTAYQPAEGSAAAKMFGWMQATQDGGRRETGWTSAELAQAANMPAKQVPSMLAGCVRAGLVRKVPGSRCTHWMLGQGSDWAALEPTTWRQARKPAQRMVQRADSPEPGSAHAAIERIDGGIWLRPVVARSIFELGSHA